MTPEFIKEKYKEFINEQAFSLSPADLLNVAKPFLSWMVNKYGDDVMAWLKDQLK